MLFMGCSPEISSEAPQDMPDDFNFSLSYGTYGKQKIDTFNNTVVKDLVVDGTVEAELTLTEEEMKRIYDEMMDINIMGDLDLEEDEICRSEPPSLSQWTIEMNGKKKSFHYSTFCDYPEHISQLYQLQDLIESIIIEKPEYKALPKSNGFYE